MIIKKSTLHCKTLSVIVIAQVPGIYGSKQTRVRGRSLHACTIIVTHIIPGFIQRGGGPGISPTEILKLSMVIIVVPSILAI